MGVVGVSLISHMGGHGGRSATSSTLYKVEVHFCGTNRHPLDPPELSSSRLWLAIWAHREVKTFRRGITTILELSWTRLISWCMHRQNILHLRHHTSLSPPWLDSYLTRNTKSYQCKALPSNFRSTINAQRSLCWPSARNCTGFILYYNIPLNITSPSP